MEKTEDSFNVLLKVSLQTEDTTWLLPPPLFTLTQGGRKPLQGSETGYFGDNKL